ncbi:argonaute/piwi family protein [Leptolyngbya sp. AN02str]|uniref:argonaute/piwi family protein n=1 Tax=Leptolyngbya sp. AN02str TaxID=3423363 RepID=UPI003D3163A4
MGSSRDGNGNSFNSATHSRKLTLNFAPIQFDDAEVTVGLMPYEGKESLRALRQNHSNTHLFHRYGNQILSVALISDVGVLGDKVETVNLSNNLYLTATLVRNALINFLHRLNRRVLKFSPVEFVADPLKENLLAKVCPSDIQIPDWISICPRYIAAIRTARFDGQPTTLGLALNVRTTKLIELPCSVLLEKGVSLSGLYVSELIRSSDSRIAPYSKLLGQVQSIEGEQLKLIDAREGVELVSAQEVFLEPRREAFNRCLEHIFAERSPDVEKDLDNLLADFRSGPSRLRRLQAVAGYLSEKSLEMLPGVTFTLQPFLSENKSRTLPPVQLAPRAVYVFDDSGEKTDTWHDRGLNEYGPYTSPTFTPSTPRICIICQGTRKGRVEQFLYKLLKGVTVPQITKKGKPQPFAKGLIHKYALDDVETHFFLATDKTAAAYDRAVREALRHQNREGFRWNLALIQIDEAFHNLYGDNNPYLTSKAAFLAEQIPTQDFEIETIDVSDYNLCYILNIMSLAIYAKLGGIPWLIKANPTITHELVFGLGSAVLSEGRLGQREQVVGITTVFSGDGNYMLSNLSKAVPVLEYKDALLESLRDTIEKVKGAMNWQVGSHIRLIFHAFKPLKDSEADAVKELMKELGDFDVEYAFIHIVKEHPFILFDESENGVFDYETRISGKGKFAPKRGMFLRVSKSEVLLSLTGAHEVKRPEDGIPTPVLLRLHRESTFGDTTYLARQVYTFSCHSWRSFFPSHMPVTITYSELIARMLGQLGTVSFWNPNAMIGRVGETRWFL